ncbi:protein PALS1 isoform X2 [Lepeophtheirus salmonis]|uniref:MAGUK p55 subfamily member 5 n=1 Tax=Lepeophtheirus salmonis TaxID=72036 RepID=A0A0K2T2U2_LEPSM|nr:MAGUK p55 subfamily member 5-like isoform X2 [Lepeophtheirus salmonis]
MVDLGGYVIILVETQDKKVKLYGSPADKADLEVADEILEINGICLENSSHTDVIAHIHNCIKSRTICLRVKRRTGNKLAKELSENSHVQDAFVIAVEQQAKERLERLSALRRIKPVDMTKLSQQLCDSSPENDRDTNPIYSAPVKELGSKTNLSFKKKGKTKVQSEVLQESIPDSNVDSRTTKVPVKSSTDEENGGLTGGHVTDEEIELCQTIPSDKSDEEIISSSIPKNNITSPSKEVLIGGDGGTHSIRRVSKTSVKSNNNDPDCLGKDEHHHHHHRHHHHINLVNETNEGLKESLHKGLSQTLSLKSIIDASDLLRCIERVERQLQAFPSDDGSSLEKLKNLATNSEFKHLLIIHNTIQAVQCFQCPPNALCSDTRTLVQECMISLQSCHLSEATELLNILHKIEFEGLFFSHDKLAELQGALPWEQCVADMWTKDRPSSSLSNSDGKKSTVKTSSGSLHSVADVATDGDMTRVIKIMKQNEPLGATVRNEGERVVIGRVVKGGAAERSGQLHPGDEVLEVNGLKLKGKSVHDICDTLCQMSGTLTFVIIPKNPIRNNVIAEEESEPVFHYRAHFSYHPDDDLYIPCHELGISFVRGDILHIINNEDPHWWQAYRDGEWTQTLAGLIPSMALQQHRMALQRQKREQDLKEAREAEKSPLRKKAGSGGTACGTGSSSLLCAKKSNKRKRTNSPFKKEKIEMSPYEEMALYYPQANQKRPVVLVGPPSIGRHELRLRLLEDINRFAAAVPHTSRPKEDGEIDGQDYNFVNRSQFEEDLVNKRFLEHGEFEKHYYGTSLDSVRTVINSGKICLLNLQPTSLQILYESDLKPYIIFLTPPSLNVYKHQKNKYGEVFKEDEYRDSVVIATEMEEKYGHHFDSVIPFESVELVYQQLLYEINLLEREPQWVPAEWVKESISASASSGGKQSQ